MVLLCSLCDEELEPGDEVKQERIGRINDNGKFVPGDEEEYKCEDCWY